MKVEDEEESEDLATSRTHGLRNLLGLCLHLVTIGFGYDATQALNGIDTSSWLSFTRDRYVIQLIGNIISHTISSPPKMGNPAIPRVILIGLKFEVKTLVKKGPNYPVSNPRNDRFFGSPV